MANAKYDWAAYKDLMIELYKTNLSISQIHRAIQNEGKGFTPSSSMMYEQFRRMGCPTDSGERKRRVEELKATSRIVKPSHTPESQSEPQTLEPPSLQWQHGVLANNTINELQWTDGYEYLAPGNSFSPAPADLAVETPHAENENNNVMIGFQQCDCKAVDIPNVPGLPTFPSTMQEINTSSWLDIDFDEAFNSDMGFIGLSHATSQSKFQNLPSKHTTNTMEHTASDQVNLYDSMAMSSNKPRFMSPRAVEKPSNTQGPNYSSPSTPLSETTHTTRSKPVTKVERPLLLSNSKLRMLRDYPSELRKSTSTSDSGYASGRGSSLGSFIDTIQPNPRSLYEFKSLYRVPCHSLHEPQPYNEMYRPQPQDRYKDTPSCPQCGYSGIHNLSWSSQYLKLEVFKSELKLSLYDLHALDAAGNSGLHYAAAGGAGLDHIISLLEAGLNPYQLNTNGQLFLHCWRPQTMTNGSEDSGESRIELFKLEFVNLLNMGYFREGAVLRWRDNYGWTPLEVRKSSIPDRELRARTHRAVSDAGYPSDLSESGSTSITPESPSKIPLSNTTPAVTASSSLDNINQAFDSQPPPNNTWQLQQDRQKKAYEILGRASSEPLYIDPETGDNILHALARLKLSQTSQILHHIQNYISKDVDLNLYNHDRDSPLAAFVCERPCHGVESDNETGAILSKYLDALLWRDQKARVENRVNVNMKNREGATALYYAAVRARPDSVRSLIEAGGNVNARLDVEGNRISILQATKQAQTEAVIKGEDIKTHLLNNVISYLELARAVTEPTVAEERGEYEARMKVMPV